MKISSRIVVAALALLTLMAAGGNLTWAKPTCPPLCILPPDPPPPWPPINFPDPPFGGLVTVKPNNGNGASTAYISSADAVASTATGTTLVGSACQYQKYPNLTGTVTLVNGKYYCADFTPPAEGSSCQYQDSTGTVTEIKGKRYCKISEPGASSKPVVHSTDTIVQRQTDAAGSAETQTAQLQDAADRAKASIQASPSEKQALLKAVRSNNAEEAKAILLRNGFTEKQLEGVSFSFEDTTGGKGNVESFSWEITIKCCPLEITIKIS
jgi:hypothetical protein